ncbi:MAG: hypothetical protein KKA05_07905 [Alphaproteobacteria bacterium]|nr:hypothetical protein [Alphaproteobacteria bacterium]MBU0859544.1 hypothetical protein [Alphaproteobacteria bacterium]
MSGMNTINNFKRKSLSGGGTNEGKVAHVVAEVKHVKEAPDPKERRIEVKLKDADARHEKMAIYAATDIARKVTPGKTYEFQLEDDPFRGGGASCFQVMKEIKRTSSKPVEVSTRTGGGGAKGMGDRFGRGYAGSHMDFI